MTAHFTPPLTPPQPANDPQGYALLPIVGRVHLDSGRITPLPGANEDDVLMAGLWPLLLELPAG